MLGPGVTLGVGTTEADGVTLGVGGTLAVGVTDGVGMGLPEAVGVGVALGVTVIVGVGVGICPQLDGANQIERAHTTAQSEIHLDQRTTELSLTLPGRKEVPAANVEASTSNVQRLSLGATSCGRAAPGGEQSNFA